MTAAVATNPRPPLEVADIFRAYGAQYERTHAVTTQQRRVMQAIVDCRTAALGGHVEACTNCGASRVAYNSCRNRHCPKCQQGKQALWVEARADELLPLEYFHVVFTLPHELNVWARRAPRVIYDLLFGAATQSLLRLGREKLGGRLGITAVLHTWGQTLQQHVHLHCIVTGGALGAEEQQFQRARPGFLGSVEALSASFQKDYLAGLQRWGQSLEQGEWGRAVAALVPVLEAQPWVVYAKRPLCGPAQVLAYLGRYTQRIAISNSRLLSLGQGRVRFRWKDYRAGGQEKVMELTCEEFMRRYLQHVLPPGYVRIRHYGILASRGREQRLARCRALLAAAPVTVRAETWSERLARWWGRAVDRCEKCEVGRMEVRSRWQGVGAGPRVRSG